MVCQTLMLQNNQNLMPPFWLELRVFLLKYGCAIDFLESWDLRESRFIVNMYITVDALVSSFKLVVRYCQVGVCSCTFMSDC